MPIPKEKISPIVIIQKNLSFLSLQQLKELRGGIDLIITDREKLTKAAEEMQHMDTWTLLCELANIANSGADPVQIAEKMTKHQQYLDARCCEIALEIQVIGANPSNYQSYVSIEELIRPHVDMMDVKSRFRYNLLTEWIDNQKPIK